MSQGKIFSAVWFFVLVLTNSLFSELAPIPSKPLDYSKPQSLDQLLDKAIRNVQGENIAIKTGGENMNIYDLNGWLIHYSEFNSGRNKDELITKKEPDLYKAMLKRASESGLRITPGDIIELSLVLNDGDMTKALLTAHNTLRHLARGKDFIEGLPKDPEFFNNYLDGTSLGVKKTLESEDITDDWYHFFVTTLISFSGQTKGVRQSDREATTRATGYAKEAHSATTTGITTAHILTPVLLSDNTGRIIGYFDAGGEQFLKVMREAGEFLDKNGLSEDNTWFGKTFGFNPVLMVRNGLLGLGVGLFKGFDVSEFKAELKGAGFGARAAATCKEIRKNQTSQKTNVAGKKVSPPAGSSSTVNSGPTRSSPQGVSTNKKKLSAPDEE